MSRHALDVLEFPRVLEHIAGRAASDAARRRIVGLRPLATRDDAVRALARVGATMTFVEEKPSWAPPPVPDVEPALRALAAPGAVLDPVPLHAVGVLLRSSRLLAQEMDEREAFPPELESCRKRLVRRRETEDQVFRTVDAEGQVLDTASPALRKIRGRLKGAHARIVRRMEAFLKTLPERVVVPDASVTIREGRYVLPIRREGKGEVGGVVHDVSQSGATLFVEPPMAMELMNELRELEREEAREIRKVLESAAEVLHPLADELRGAWDALVDFDTLYARARCALAWRAVPPTFCPEGDETLVITEGRHPLLLEAAAGPVIPFDLRLEPGERALVVTGPNTGGKSVLLKAVGLTCSLGQAGVVPPVGRGTRLPFFDAFFADIGDEQSITQNLSTFSAHLANLSEIVTAAGPGSLVLIDEMGTGTDPAEGAALSRAVLEELVSRGARTLVSSHLGDLKRLDEEGSGVVNASLQFDEERMEPTYRLIKGRPGRSYGLAIARRSGLPGSLLDRAEGYLDRDEARLEELLGRLEARERELEDRLARLDAQEARAENREAELAARERRVEEAERAAADKARREARKILMESRAEVEAAIREVRAAVERPEALPEVERRARRRVEEAAREAAPMRRSRSRGGGGRSRRGPDGPDGGGATPGDFGELTPGEGVRVASTGARGRLLEVRGDRARVEVGGLKLEVSAHELEPLTGSETSAGSGRGGWRGSAPIRAQRGGGGRGAGGWSGAEEAVRMEVDLRGLRVDELDLALNRALDQAVYEDLADLRIIHGKGTGALRARVGEVLDADPRVRRHRPGGPTEGGAGVTVAVFREDGA